MFLKPMFISTDSKFSLLLVFVKMCHIMKGQFSFLFSLSFSKVPVWIKISWPKIEVHPLYGSSEFMANIIHIKSG